MAKEEIRVYLVDSMNEVENWDELPNDEFIRMAEEEGKVYSLQGFVKAFNEEEINSSIDFIRII